MPPDWEGQNNLRSVVLPEQPAVATGHPRASTGSPQKLSVAEGPPRIVPSARDSPCPAPPRGGDTTGEADLCPAPCSGIHWNGMDCNAVFMIRFPQEEGGVGFHPSVEGTLGTEGLRMVSAGFPWGITCV